MIAVPTKFFKNFTFYIIKNCKNYKKYIIFIIEEVIYGNNKQKS